MIVSMPKETIASLINPIFGRIASSLFVWITTMSFCLIVDVRYNLGRKQCGPSWNTGAMGAADRYAIKSNHRKKIAKS